MTLKGENGFEMKPALDEFLRVVASCRCRCILYYFAESDNETCSVGVLSDYVLGHDPEAVDRERVETSLHHNELPRLDEADVVDFDARSRTVRFRGVHECEQVLTAISEVESER